MTTEQQHRTTGLLPVREHLRPVTPSHRDAMVYTRDRAGGLFCMMVPVAEVNEMPVAGEA